MRAEFKKTENGKAVETNNEAKTRFCFGFDNPLARLIRENREKPQMTSIRNKGGKVITNSRDIKMIIKKY